MELGREERILPGREVETVAASAAVSSAPSLA